MRYLKVNQRAASPKFLFGESYGTLRTVVLANVLETAGVALNGIVLQSSVLNYNTNCGLFDPITLSCAGYVPAYAAIGAYYGLDRPNPVDLPAALVNVRTFTTTSYAPAVNAFLATGAAPPAGLVDQLAALTGAPAALWIAHFDLDPGNFQTGLIPNTIIGRYDARVSAPRGSVLAADGDPSSTVVNGQFIAAIASYLPAFLQYTAASAYAVSSNAIDVWNFHHDGLALPDAIPDLGAALAQNPKLQVLALSGYDDLATPFFQTELDLARLGTMPNIQVSNYPGGHMLYLDDGSRPQEKADLVRFYRAAQAITP
jgi:carboxypeptidase C (cathepsin A)